jgi:cytochrome oxidase assembly protein ShyY1
LASKRWLVRIVAGLLLVAACVRLGMWQLDRNDERSGRNDLIEAARDTEPDPINNILSPGIELADDDVWHPVEVSGRYDADNQFVVQLRPLDGEQGVHVLTPLVTGDGAAVLVDRGFLPATDVNLPAEALPPPPPGDVEAVVRIRASEAGRGSGNATATRQIRYIDTSAIAPALPYPVYQAWGELVSQTPDPDAALVLIPPPDTDSGPHLSYAVQWFIFACIGVGGFIALVRAEAKGRRKLTEDDNQPQPAH